MIPPRRGNSGKQERSNDALDITAVLLHYGADRVPDGSGWKKMRCIHGERNPSATVNIEEGAFNCFSCGLRGDVISIIRKMENDCSYFAACAKYEEITGQKIAGAQQRRNNETITTATTKSYESGGYLASRLRK